MSRRLPVQTICQLFSFDNFPALERVVLHIEAREGEVQSFMYASEADVLFDVEYRGHVFKTPVNPHGTMKDLKVNAVTVGLAGTGDA